MSDRALTAAPELPYLEAFRVVCELGSFTAAARLLGCSQPAVSYQVRKLEEICGATLLERSGRRIVLTPAGERLRALADEVTVQLARIRNETLAGHTVSPLRLGAASGFGRYVLVPALLALREEQSGSIEIRLQYDAADVVLDELAAGQHDAAFVYKRRITNALAFEHVYDEELVLIAGPELGAVLRDRGLDRLHTFAEVPFVTYEECDYVFGRWFDTAFAAQPARVVSSGHFTELEEVLEFVKHGDGVSIVPRDCAEHALANGSLAVLYAGSTQPCRNGVFLVTRAAGRPNETVQRLAELVRLRSPSRAN